MRALHYGWLAVIFCLLPLTSRAQHTFGDFSYSYDGPTITITSYTGAGGDVTIPGTIDGLPVVTIGEGAFAGCSGLTNVTLPNSVTSIGDDAFFVCSGLTSVTLPNSVTNIGIGAFSACSGLTNVTLPNSVTSIGDWGFGGCSGLTNVTLPNSVTNIGIGAFSDCSRLTAFAVESANPAYTSLDGVLFDKSQITLVQFPGRGTGHYTVPNSVASIGGYAFSSCSRLTSIAIANRVTSIGDHAFSACSGLTNVTLPNSVTNIGDGAFVACSGLTAFAVETTNPAYSSLDGVLFNQSQTALIQFPGARAGNYTIPDSVTSIGEWAFLGCSGLTSVTLPNSVTSIGEGMFAVCSGLTNVTLLNSVTNIGDGAFYWCFGLTSVILGNSVTSIGYSAFAGCSGLTRITIPDSVTSIGGRAFAACSGLTSVTLGNGVTSIGYGAFDSCSRLRTLFFRGNAPAVGFDALGPPTDCYYLPGSSGWGETLGSQPAYLWNPAPQTSGPSFGVRTNCFGFNITGTADIPIVVEASTDLANAVWVPLQSCTLTNGLIYFSDPAWRNFPTRAYRIRSP